MSRIDPVNPFLRYVALGWSVIPVKRGTKMPYAELLPEVADPEAEGGTRRSWKPFQERHPTREELEEWGAQATNIAVVLGHVSGIIVLDLDSDTAIRTATERGIPQTATARSSKGIHLYFKHPGGRVRNYRDAAEQWDLKGDGGLVNAPPSVHPSGVIYTWEAAPEVVGIAAAPEWLLAIIQVQQAREAEERAFVEAVQPTLSVQEARDETGRRRTLYFERAITDELDTLGRVGEGGRNHALNAAAYALGQLVAGAMQEQANSNALQDAERLESQIRADLLTSAMTIGLSRHEATRTIASGIQSGKQKARTLPDFTIMSDRGKQGESASTLHKVTTDRDEIVETTKGKGSKPSEANVLIELGLGATFFHTDAGERYVRYPVGQRFDTAHVNHSKSPFRLWLHRHYYEAFGEPPNPGAMSQALQHLEQVALYDGALRKVFTRVGVLAEVMYIYVGDEAGHIVEIDTNGWRVLADAPVIFRTTRNAQPLPFPQQGGTIDLLRPFVNVADETAWKLVVGWMLGALNPWGPYAHLALKGEQDTGKSTLLRILRMFTDPAKAEENSDPKTVDDFMVTTLNNHVISYDNLSSIPDWLSDALCRIATGAGLTKRMLYSDLEEIVIDTARPALLNGIADVITRPDLLERTLVLELPRIEASRRLTERALGQQLDKVAPLVFGALLDAVVMALRQRDSVHLPRLPRMADFVTWVTAAAPALGWQANEFLEAYEDNVMAKEQSVLEMDEVAQAIVAWADGRSEARVTVTMKELLEALSGDGAQDTSVKARFSPDWPRTPRELSTRLTRAQPVLRKFGIEILRGNHTRNGRVYHIAKRAEVHAPTIHRRAASESA